MFPLPVQKLDGRRVLLIGLVEADSRTAYLVAGMASWSGARLCITHDPDLPGVEPLGSAAAWRGFDPAVLPQILLPAAWRQVQPLARDVSACVAAWIPTPISSALAIRDAFYGLAGNRNTGEVFLMQGDPSVIAVLSEHPDLDADT